MEYIIISWQPPTCCVHFLENASLKVVPGHQTSPPFMCVLFFGTHHNELIVPNASWSNKLIVLPWKLKSSVVKALTERLYSFTTHRQILNRCGKLCRVKWASPRAFKRKCVCVYVWTSDST